jgi:hypothetical protein
MIQWSLAAPIGAGGLVTIAVLMIFTGRWWPRSVLRDWVQRSTYEEVKADRDLWRSLALENRSQFQQVILPTALAAQKTFEAVDQAVRAKHGRSELGGD